MADRIVVINAGDIEQVGSPLDLYNRPSNVFVAGFLGSPRMNFFPARVAASGRRRGRSLARRHAGRQRPACDGGDERPPSGSEVLLGVRPESFRDWASRRHRGRWRPSRWSRASAARRCSMSTPRRSPSSDRSAATELRRRPPGLAAKPRARCARSGSPSTGATSSCSTRPAERSAFPNVPSGRPDADIQITERTRGMSIQCVTVRSISTSTPPNAFPASARASTRRASAAPSPRRTSIPSRSSRSAITAGRIIRPRSASSIPISTST